MKARNKERGRQIEKERERVWGTESGKDTERGGDTERGRKR